MAARDVGRWDVYRVALDPVRGSEQAGTRPAIVVSNDGFNAHFDVVTVVPLTKARGKRRRVYGFEVLLPAGVAGNAEDSIAMPQQIRTVARERLGDRVATLADPHLQAEIEGRLLEHLGIDFVVEWPGRA
jgi:mRNA interferase MazF